MTPERLEQMRRGTRVHLLNANGAQTVTHGVCIESSASERVLAYGQLSLSSNAGSGASTLEGTEIDGANR